VEEDDPSTIAGSGKGEKRGLEETKERSLGEEKEVGNQNAYARTVRGGTLSVNVGQTTS